MQSDNKTDKIRAHSKNCAFKSKHLRVLKAEVWYKNNSKFLWQEIESRIPPETCQNSTKSIIIIAPSETLKYNGVTIYM
jgi:hypothetical protein